MFKKIALFLASLTFSLNVLAANDPSDIVKDFYDAINQKDCQLALELRPNFSQERCKKIAKAAVQYLETIESDEQNAVVAAKIALTSADKEQLFDGFIHLKMDKQWQLHEFAESSSTSAAAFKAKYLQQSATRNNVTSIANDSVDLADPQTTLTMLQANFPHDPTSPVVLVDISAQRMALFKNGKKLSEFPISTATKGAGNQAGSDQTPLGAHKVSEKFGDTATKGTIFEARRDTGKLAEILTEPVDVPTDHVTTRILWLDGLELGKNKGGNTDSKSRFIYIHGTPEEGLIGQPASHGCIRMKNDDVMDVYRILEVGTLVYIGA